MLSSIRRILCFTAVLLTTLWVSAIPASAHSQLISTNPAAESILKSSPKTIELTFSENVETTFGSLRLYNDAGERISTSSPELRAGNIVRVKPPKLEKGTYVVAWNVVSADSHPIRGAFTFSVNSPTTSSADRTDAISSILNNEQTSSISRIVFACLRFLIFMCLALVIGVVALRFFVVQSSLSPPVNRILYGALAVLALASLASIGFQASLAGQFSLAKAFSFDILNQERTTRFGQVQIVRASLCVLLCCWWRFPRGPLLNARLGLCTLALAATPAFAGHASAGKYVALAFTNDVVHVLCAGAWFGGLLVLPFLLSRDEGGKIARKFSRMALVCVIAIGITGVFAWWRQVGSYEASVTTWFGQLINVKAIIFLCVIAVAWFSRQHVHRLSVSNSEGSKGRLIRLVYFESALLIVVMIATSIVVNAVPGRTALALPVTKYVSAESVRMEVSIDPPKTGPIVLHIFVLRKNGTLYTFSQGVNTLGKPALSASWLNKNRDVGPLPLNIRYAGGNHFISTGTSVPFSGTWTLTLRLRLSEFDEQVTSTEVTIR